MEWHTMSNTPAIKFVMEKRLSLLVEVAHNLGVLRSVARKQCRLVMADHEQFWRHALIPGEPEEVYYLEIHPELKVILDAGKYSKMPNKIRHKMT